MKPKKRLRTKASELRRQAEVRSGKRPRNPPTSEERRRKAFERLDALEAVLDTAQKLSPEDSAAVVDAIKRQIYAVHIEIAQAHDSDYSDDGDRDDGNAEVASDGEVIEWHGPRPIRTGRVISYSGGPSHLDDNMAGCGQSEL
jgi:hypothetical protein